MEMSQMRSLVLMNLLSRVSEISVGTVISKLKYILQMKVLPNYQTPLIVHIMTLHFHQYTMIPTLACQPNITNSEQ